MTANTPDIIGLTRDLCAFRTGVVAADNAPLFDRIAQEIPITLHRFPSGERFNGWQVPDEWSVQRALVTRDGQVIADLAGQPLGVAYYSRSFEGEMDLDELRPRLVTNPAQPDAYVFHCRWQYRPWEADWALSLPASVADGLAPGRYAISLETTYVPGQMLVADYEHRGQTAQTIVFNSHTCHPGQANDGMVGVATLIRLFQWLQGRTTRYTYRLVLGPEHLGTVFYLRGREAADIDRMVGGAFVEMTGIPSPIVATSTFLGDQPLDRVLRKVLRDSGAAHEIVGWRQGAGNDETVWEAPGYEVPFTEITRRIDTFDPYPEYHTNLDTPESLDAKGVHEVFNVLCNLIDALEGNATPIRLFDGLVCLSSPEIDLYPERKDPAISQTLADDSERWGALVDRLLRWMDGSKTILDIAEEADLPFKDVQNYIERFEEKGLIRLDPVTITRPPAKRMAQKEE
jgi:aminopeptidase-like protein